MEIWNIHKEWLALSTASRNTSAAMSTRSRKLVQLMSVFNARFPKDDRYGETASAKKLLFCVKTASQYLYSQATTELNSTAERGLCWWPAGGPLQPATRDMMLVMRMFNQLWREAVCDNYIKNYSCCFFSPALRERPQYLPNTLARRQRRRRQR